jgi:hypothetical protein
LGRGSNQRYCVLEHVADWDSSFRNLSALVAPTGVVIVTVPFIFPLHMEPVDFLRGTPYVIEQWMEKVSDEQYNAAPRSPDSQAQKP